MFGKSGFASPRLNLSRIDDFGNRFSRLPGLRRAGRRRYNTIQPEISVLRAARRSSTGSVTVMNNPEPFPADIRLRPAGKQDVPVILGFIRELAEFEQAGEIPAATEERLTRFLFGERAYAEVVLAEADRRPVGQALFFHNFCTSLAQPGLYLEDLYVQPRMRGKGVGRALLCYLARLALQRGCSHLEWAVLADNRKAIAFYRTLGALPLADWRMHSLNEPLLRRLAEQAI
jgi:GNAT superfamily N-acetyltransferase